MSYSEWDLMCISEDIEPGDTVVIEHLKEPALHKSLIYVGNTDDGQWIHCMESNRQKEYFFNVDSLDEKGKRTKRWRILKKSPVALRWIK